MRVLKTGEFPVVVVPRTCSRCGRGFGALGREHVCKVCRKPKASKNRVLSCELSFRERQIINLVQKAKSNKEIAFELCLCEGTVKEYLHTAFRKLGVKNRTELALWACVHLDRSETVSKRSGFHHK